MIFNPRLREGGDLFPVFIPLHSRPFQSTPPRRRRPNLEISSWRQYSFQSTPPRRRRQHHSCNHIVSYQFSIHASAKEATYRYIVMRNLKFFSIHASAKEATATYCNTPAIMCISSLNNFFVHHF